MALKIWTFLLVMSLPAAEHGHGFGSLAAVVLSNNNIDYHRIQQHPYYYVDRNSSAAHAPARGPDDDRDEDDYAAAQRRMGKRSAPKILNKNKNKNHHNQYAASASSATAAEASQSADGRCMARVQSKLADMMSASANAATYTKGNNRRHNAGLSLGYMDLSGYALHQRLRTAPGAEMYVTGMRAKVLPPLDLSSASADSSFSPTGDFGGDRSWARVDECRYDPTGNTLEARMRFGRPLAVSGSVRLLYGGGGGGNRAVAPGETGCDMTLRLRPRAGLGFTAVPMTMPEKSPPNRLTATAPMTIRTTATFIDPEPADEAADPAAAYVSVHSYNCVGGAAGMRERPQVASAADAESTDRFEQFASAEETPSSSSSALDAEFDIDLDDNDDGFGDSAELSDKRSSSRRPAATTTRSGGVTTVAPPSTPAAAAVTAADPAIRPFGPAGFITMAAVPGPEPRLRRIQYHGSRPHFHYQQQYQQQPLQPQQHPLLSVHAPSSSLAGFNPPVNRPQDHAHDHLLMEMEEVFVRGVRSLLAKHMERTLQPVLKDSLMVNMGYTVSYG